LAAAPAFAPTRVPRSTATRTPRAGRHDRTWARLSWHAALAIGLVAALGAPAAAQTLHYGMNTRVLTPRLADKIVRPRADIVRLAYGWDTFEPRCKGCFDWTVTDGWRDEAKRTHRAIFGSLAYAPSWANGGHPYNYPPLVAQDYYDFVYAVIARYKDDIF